MKSVLDSFLLSHEENETGTQTPPTCHVKKDKGHSIQPKSGFKMERKLLHFKGLHDKRDLLNVTHIYARI